MKFEMFIRLIYGLYILSQLNIGHASQAGARQPVSAPSRDIPWGQLNFLHTTDTHGWHAGHLQE